MADDKTDEPVNQLEPEPVSTPLTVSLYANYTAVTATPEEFILRFCLRDFNDPSKATELARVFLSLGHAKRLVVAIARSLKSYEELFGEIPSDPLQHLTAEGRTKFGVKDSKEK